MADDDFIAADLTLYSNPLNRALGKMQPSAGHVQNNQNNKSKIKESSDKKENEQDEEEQEIIAADLTTYDSPMGELERSEKERALNQEEEIRRAAARRRELLDHQRREDEKLNTNNGEK